MILIVEAIIIGALICSLMFNVTMYFRNKELQRLYLQMCDTYNRKCEAEAIAEERGVNIIRTKFNRFTGQSYE